MSRDHRPPIRNPFLPPTPEKSEVPARDGDPPAGPAAPAYGAGRGRAEVTSAGTEPNQALTVPGPLLDLAPSRCGPSGRTASSSACGRPDPAQPSGAKIASTTCCAHSSSGTSTRS